MSDTVQLVIAEEKQLITVTMSHQSEGSTHKLIVCFLGIFVSYLIYGILQEEITKSEYGPNGEKFTYMLALVFVQCIVNALFAKIALATTSQHERDTTSAYLYIIMSVSYVGAMLASNHALQFVSYPTQVLGKSVKPIPVMILGVLLARKRYPLSKYLFILMIVIGVTMFMYKDKQAKGLDSDHVFGFGEILLLVSLALDGVTGGIQDRMRAEHRTHAHSMMLHLNIWSILLLGVALLVTGEGLQFLQFASTYPRVLISAFAFSVCSAIGQNFIFITVTNFGPLMCSIFTTTRKFFTILGSVIFFQHPMTERQWLGTLFVFIGLILDHLYGKEPKQGTQKH